MHNNSQASRPYRDILDSMLQKVNPPCDEHHLPKKISNLKIADHSIK